MVSWSVPYLAKGSRSDFNNGLEGDTSSAPIKSDCSSPSYFSLVSDGVTSI